MSTDLEKLMSRTFPVFECVSCGSIYINAKEYSKHLSICVKHKEAGTSTAVEAGPPLPSLKSEPGGRKPASSEKPECQQETGRSKRKTGKYTFKPVEAAAAASRKRKLKETEDKISRDDESSLLDMPSKLTGGKHYHAKRQKKEKAQCKIKKKTEEGNKKKCQKWYDGRSEEQKEATRKRDRQWRQRSRVSKIQELNGEEAKLKRKRELGRLRQARYVERIKAHKSARKVSAESPKPGVQQRARGRPSKLSIANRLKSGKAESSVGAKSAKGHSSQSRNINTETEAQQAAEVTSYIPYCNVRGGNGKFVKNTRNKDLCGTSGDELSDGDKRRNSANTGQSHTPLTRRRPRTDSLDNSASKLSTSTERAAASMACMLIRLTSPRGYKHSELDVVVPETPECRPASSRSEKSGKMKNTIASHTSQPGLETPTFVTKPRQGSITLSKTEGDFTPLRSGGRKHPSGKEEQTTGFSEKSAIIQMEINTLSEEEGVAGAVGEPGGQVPVSKVAEANKIMNVVRTGDYMCRYLASREFSDAVIKTDIADIPVHKVVLASRYPQLSQCLLNEGVIDMSDLSYGHVSSWLKYIYTNDESGLSNVPFDVLSQISRFILQSTSGNLSRLNSSDVSTSLISPVDSTQPLVRQTRTPATKSTAPGNSTQPIVRHTQTPATKSTLPIDSTQSKVRHTRTSATKSISPVNSTQPKVRHTRTSATKSISPVNSTQPKVRHTRTSATKSISPVNSSQSEVKHTRTSATKSISPVNSSQSEVKHTRTSVSKAALHKANKNRAGNKSNQSAISYANENFSDLVTSTPLDRKTKKRRPNKKWTKRKQGGVQASTYIKHKLSVSSIKSNKSLRQKSATTIIAKRSQGKFRPYAAEGGQSQLSLLKTPARTSVGKSSSTQSCLSSKQSRESIQERKGIKKPKADSASALSLAHVGDTIIANSNNTIIANSPVVRITRIKDVSHCITTKIERGRPVGSLGNKGKKSELSNTSRNLAEIQSDTPHSSGKETREPPATVITTIHRAKLSAVLPSTSYNIHKFTDNSLTKKTYLYNTSGRRGGRRPKAKRSIQKTEGRKTDRECSSASSVWDGENVLEALSFYSDDGECDRPASVECMVSHTLMDMVDSVVRDTSVENSVLEKAYDHGENWSAAGTEPTSLELVTEPTLSDDTSNEIATVFAQLTNRQMSVEVTEVVPAEVDDHLAQDLTQTHREVTSAILLSDDSDAERCSTDENIPEVICLDLNASGLEGDSMELTAYDINATLPESVAKPSESEPHVGIGCYNKKNIAEDDGSGADNDSSAHFDLSSGAGEKLDQCKQSGAMADQPKAQSTVTEDMNPVQLSSDVVQPSPDPVQSTSTTQSMFTKLLPSKVNEDKDEPTASVNDNLPQNTAEDLSSPNDSSLDMMSDLPATIVNPSNTLTSQANEHTVKALNDGEVGEDNGEESVMTRIKHSSEISPKVVDLVSDDEDINELADLADDSTMKACTDVTGAPMSPDLESPFYTVDADVPTAAIDNSAGKDKMENSSLVDNDVWSDLDDWKMSSACSGSDALTKERPEGFKSPNQPKGLATHRAYVPSPMTPRENYEEMSDDQLKKKMREYGLRDKMSRKRMLAALSQIYTETHQYETDTSAEWTVLPTPRKPGNESQEEGDTAGSAVHGSDSSSADRLPALGGCGDREIDLTVSDGSSVCSSELEIMSPPPQQSPPLQPAAEGDFKSGPKNVQIITPEQHRLNKGTPSEIDKLLSDVDLLLEDSDSSSSENKKLDNQTLSLNVSSSSEDESSTDEELPAVGGPDGDLLSADNLDTQLGKIIIQNNELYTRILSYQMIPRDELIALVKSSKIKCSKAQLDAFCYKQCIPVQNKQDQKPRVKKRHGKKKKTVKQN